MRVVVADCSVVYTGRGDTRLPRAVRAIIIKDDGCVAIHNDKSNKPLNYMGSGNVFTQSFEEDETVWMFDTRKESLQITMHALFSDSFHRLDLDSEGLVRDGTENHLQAWIAENPESIGEGFTLVGREYQTGEGPVDLLMQDAEGNHVAVEVKRTAMTASVDQVRRYVEALTPSHPEVRGIIAAADVRPNTIKLAEKRGIEWVEIPSDWKKTLLTEEVAED